MKRLVLACLLVVLSLPLAACPPTPPDLTPEAQVAFKATRVVRALDVVRDAAIAAEDTTPPMFSRNSTRAVVLWHQTAVKIIQAAPGGWKPALRVGLYNLTCDVAFTDTQPPPPCQSPLAPQELTHLKPYMGLVVVVINEVTK